MKKRTKRWIALPILLLLAAGVGCFGFFADRLFAHVDDALQLSDADIGTAKTFRMTDEAIDGDETSYLLDFNADEEDVTMLRVIIPENRAEQFRNAFESKELFSGTVWRCTPEMTAENEQFILNFMNIIAENTPDFEVTDEVKATIPGFLSPYYIELTQLGSGSDLFRTVRAVCYGIGGLLAFAAICMLIAAIFDKSFGKVSLAVGLILGIPILVLGIIFRSKIMTVLSVREVKNGLYFMEFADTVETDKLLAEDIHSISELIQWVRKEEFCNLPFSYDEQNIGCSAFLAKTPEGDVLMSRNFDYPETDAVLVHSAPKGGYASYAMADLQVLGIRNRDGFTSPDSVLGKILMLAAPYCVEDGINEAGLSAAILELDIGETHMNTEKHDLLIYTAVRVLLDKCATVDEAVKLLADRDIHSGIGATSHLFIADKTGRSVVVEWLDDEMYVNELDAATNSVVTEGPHYDRGADERLPAIKAGLSEHNGILTKEQAKELISAAAQKDYTEWSCVYDLTNYSFDVYMDEDFENPIHFPQ